MEQTIKITCPVSVGDKIYRLDKGSNIITEVIKKIDITTKEYLEEGIKESFSEHTTIMFHTNHGIYGTHQIGNEIFLYKKELVQKIVSQL